MSETSEKKPSSLPMPLILGAVIGGLAIGVVGTLLVGGSQKTGGGSSPDTVVAEFNGKQVKASEAFAAVKPRLFDLEEELFRIKETAINEYIEQRLVENEAKTKNMPIDQLLEKEAGAGAGAPAEVADKDIDSFLAAKGLSLKDPRIRKEDVRDYLKYKGKFELRQAYVAKLRTGARVKVFIKEPESPKVNVVVDGYPMWGNPKAPVTIVEFSDYQCPFCSRAIPTLKRIKEEYGPDKVRIVFRDMPLPSHGRAPSASLAAHCANDQSKFWEMHDMLFDNQAKLEDADLKSYAKKLGLDEKKFNECYDGKKHMALIDKSRSEAETLGIQATPSFVINGALLQGAQPFEKFKEKIDRAGRG